jgi:hypothetical protein
MEALLGFQLDFWDYATFATLAIIGASFMALIYLVLGLPGRIAVARRHPEAEAVSIMGWLGFIAIVPWVQAFIWAFKPADVVDIRNLPRDVRRDTDEQIARLTGVPVRAPPASTSEAPPRPSSEPPKA